MTDKTRLALKIGAAFAAITAAETVVNSYQVDSFALFTFAAILAMGALALAVAAFEDSSK